MIRLDLSREPRWLDLGHGVRLRVAPLTTSLMAAARSDPSVTGLPEGASNETIAVTMAKALARLVVLDWEGVGDTDGNAVCRHAGRDRRPARHPAALRGVPAALRLEGPAAGRGKKRLRALSRMALQRGRPVLPILPRHLRRVPSRPEPAADHRGLAGLGPGPAAHRPAARRAGGHPRPRHDRRTRHGRCAGHRHAGLRRAAARGRGHDGARPQRPDQG